MRTLFTAPKFSVMVSRVPLELEMEIISREFPVCSVPGGCCVDVSRGDTQ